MPLTKPLLAATLILAALGAQATNRANDREHNHGVTGSFESNSQHGAQKHNDNGQRDVGKPYLYTPPEGDDIADLSPAAISSVPEPETVLMMLIGVGIIGAIVRRRAKGNAG